MKKILLLMISWGVEIFAFQRWFGCWLFKENFYFTQQNLMTHLINDINADQGMPVIVVRVIHNKLFALLWGLLQSLFQYWDVRFLEEFIGVVGAVGVGFGIWYICTKDRKNKLLWILLLLGVGLSIINAFFQPHIRYESILLTFGVIFQALSLYGIWRFLGIGDKKRYASIVLLLIISCLFIFLFPLAYQNFCLKI